MISRLPQNRIQRLHSPAHKGPHALIPTAGFLLTWSPPTPQNCQTRSCLRAFDFVSPPPGMVFPRWLPPLINPGLALRSPVPEVRLSITEPPAPDRLSPSPTPFSQSCSSVILDVLYILITDLGLTPTELYAPRRWAGGFILSLQFPRKCLMCLRPSYECLWTE